MNAKKIEELYAHPERLNTSELAMLKQAVSDFPYAAPLQALYMKALQQQESYLLPAQVMHALLASFGSSPSGHGTHSTASSEIVPDGHGKH